MHHSTSSTPHSIVPCSNRIKGNPNSPKVDGLWLEQQLQKKNAVKLNEVTIHHSRKSKHRQTFMGWLTLYSNSLFRLNSLTSRLCKTMLIFTWIVIKFHDIAELSFLKVLHETAHPTSGDNFLRPKTLDLAPPKRLPNATKSTSGCWLFGTPEVKYDHFMSFLGLMHFVCWIFLCWGSILGLQFQRRPIFKIHILQKCPTCFVLSCYGFLISVSGMWLQPATSCQISSFQLIRIYHFKLTVFQIDFNPSEIQIVNRYMDFFLKYVQ